MQSDGHLISADECECNSLSSGERGGGKEYKTI